MSRPKSAKPGIKIDYQQPALQDSRDADSILDEQQQSIYRKNFKNRLLSANYKKSDRKLPQYTTGGVGRLVPQKMPQDKQRLYLQTIGLKKQMNNIQSQNLILKTKLIKLEKQNKKLEKKLQTHDEFIDRPKSRVHSGILGPQIQSSKVPAMKRMVREAKDESEYLRIENERIKKSVKYTRLTQLQNQNKTLLDEMNKMANVIDQLTQEERNFEKDQKELQNIRTQYGIKIKENQILDEKNKDLEHQMYQMDLQHKNYQQRAIQKQKRYYRELDINKRKLQIAQKQILSLKNQVNRFKTERAQANAYSSLGSNGNNSKKVLIKRNTSAKPTFVPKSEPRQNSASTNKNVNQEQKVLKQELDALKTKNQKLQKQNNYLTTTIKQQQQKLYQTQRNNSNNNQTNKITSNAPLDKEQDNYNEDFEPFAKEDNDDDGSVEFLLNDQNQKAQEPEIKQKSKKLPEQKQKGDKVGAAHKKALVQIRSLITYRLQAHRYPFEFLQQEINNSPDKEFKLSDISMMLENQPFFLNKKQIKNVLKLMSPKQFKNLNSMVSIDILISKLRKLVDNFELIDESKEQEMSQHISQIVVDRLSQLQQQFDKKGNQDDSTIAQKPLRQIFTSLGLQKRYIDLIISEMCLYSEDLQHLNYEEFLNRFVDTGDMGVEEVDEEYEDEFKKRIVEEQLEQSQDSRSKVTYKPNVK